MKRPVYLACLIIIGIAFSVQAEELTLNDALAKRAVGSRILKMAKMSTDIAEENVTASRSGYLPRIDLQGGYTAQQAPQAISMQQGTFETQQSDYGFLNLSIYQTIYDFGRTSSRTAQAEAVREVTRINYRSQEQDLFLQTVYAYFRILQMQNLLKTATEEVTQMTDHLGIAKNLLEQGVVTRNDLLQAEVRLAASRHRRLETANRLENAWLDLNSQIGDPPRSRKELVPETKFDLTDPDKSAEDVISMRPEIQAQRKLLDAHEIEIEQTRTGYFPELFAKLGLDYVQNEKVKEQAIYSATVGIKINLFDGLATTSRYRQAVMNRSRTEEQLHQLESDLALEYRIAANDAKVARERIAVTDAAVRQGEENLRINRDRYSEQVGTATDVIDAQTLLTQIKTDQYQALFDYQVALARVKRARGEL